MKTNLDKFFKTNKQLEQEGVDFTIDDKTSFKVRRFNDQNPRVKAAMAQYYKPYERMIQMGTLGVEQQNEITIKLFIDCSLVSWKGIEDSDGKPIEFSKENALALFKSLPDLFSTLWKYANEMDSYLEQVGKP